MRSAQLLLASLALAGAQRALHWVTRVSELERTLNFTQHVLGMQVLRHEENEDACPITCNGKFDTSWSKTMVGYGDEDTHFALELTYNYGIVGYERGDGLRRFVLWLDEAAAAAATAAEMGFAVEAVDGASRVVGPDGYVYELHQTAADPDGILPRRAEPFDTVVLSSENPVRLARWYVSLLGMEHVPLGDVDDLQAIHTRHPPGTIAVGFGGEAGRPSAVRYVFEPSASRPRVTEWEGRNAIALPESTVRAINARLIEESPELIVHELRELHEALGLLVIVIIRDPEGYEICIVSSETFDPSVKAATDHIGPDWARRNGLLAAMKVHDEL